MEPGKRRSYRNGSLGVMVNFSGRTCQLTLRLYRGDRARGTNPLTSFSSFPPSVLSGSLHFPDPIRSHKGWDPIDPFRSPEKGREWTWRGKQKIAMHKRLGSSKQ